MQLTIDTNTDTSSQLTAAAHFLQALAGVPVVAAPVAAVVEVQPKNDSPDNTSGNAPALPAGAIASTDIPAAPANASASENPTPVPAAPSDIPAAPANEQTAAPAGPLDSAGFPWDARIHTANKAKIGDNTWRKKPGVDAALYESVRAEWTAGQGSVPAVPALDPNAAATGAIPAAPAPDNAAPAVPTLTAQDVLARCTEVQMSDMSKGAALFQAIVAAGVASGPMGLPQVTDLAVLAACLEAVNKVAAA